MSKNLLKTVEVRIVVPVSLVLNSEVSIVSTPGSTQESELSPQQHEPLEEIFDRIHGELLGTLHHLLGSMEDAQDALQETFIKCWRNQHKLPEIQNLRAWIFRIAINTGRDIRESAWRRKRKGMSFEEETLPAATAGPAMKAERSEQMDNLRLAVDQLRDEERDVFLLRQNGEMTYDEIGDALAIPTGTVKTRMRLALEKLRKVLAPPDI